MDRDGRRRRAQRSSRSAALSLAVYAAWLFHDMPDASELADYHPPTATRVYAWDGTLIGEFSTRAAHLRALRPDAAAADQRLPGRRGPQLLPARRRRRRRHAARHGQGRRSTSCRDAGSRAARPSPSRWPRTCSLTNEATVRPQAQGGDPRHAAREDADQAADPRALSQRDLAGLPLLWRAARPPTTISASRSATWILAQCAYLAALPKGPDNYQPVRNKAAAIRRRNWIIGQMADLGWVSRAAGRARPWREDLDGPAARRAGQIPRRRLFRRRGRASARARRSAPKVNEGGYYMRTTLDPRLQTTARDRADERAGDLRPPPRLARAPGATSRSTPRTGRRRRCSRTPPSERRDLARGAASTGRRRSRCSSPTTTRRATSSRADVAWARAGKGLNDGRPGLRRAGRRRRATICARCRRSTARWSPSTPAPAGCWPWSAATASRSPTSTAPPRRCASPARRSSRSSTPRRWRTASRPASIVLDAPITLPGRHGQIWTPENYETQVPRSADLPARPRAV